MRGKMKIIHICGFTAVGKNHLIKKLRAATETTPGARTEEQRYLLDRFELIGNVAFPDPVSPDPGRPLEVLKQDLDSIIRDGDCETIVHRWQYKSATIAQYLRKEYPDIEQRTFIIWLNPIQHIHNALSFRTEDYIQDFSEKRLGNNFVDCFKRVIFHATKTKEIINKEDYPEYDEINSNKAISQLSEHQISVVTPISKNLYSDIDAVNLKMILRRKT